MSTSTLTMSPSIPSTPFIPVKLATTTTTTTPTTPLSHPTSANAPLPPTQPRQNTAATLRPLYARAVRAFLHRDIVLTHSLLSSAFALISPPLTLAPDPLTDFRRKWDVLRITLEVTVYTAPPADTASIPATLRSNALLSAAALLASLHTRSLRLFAPADGPAPNPAFLPPQVLVTLALSSAKIGCPAAGRGIIEEWLACRTTSIPAPTEDGYEKVLEVYLLTILPALGDWAYAKQFIGYETELPVQSRERLATSLASLHGQHLASLVREPPTPVPAAPSAPTTPKPPPSSAPVITRSSSSSSYTDSSSAMTTPTPSRPSSPTPSSSSTSSNSTHTAVPANPHPRTSRSKQQEPAHGHSTNVHALSPLTPTPSNATFTAPTTYAHDTPPFLRATSRAQGRGDAGGVHSPTRRSTTPETRPSSWHVLTRSSASSSSSSSLIESMHAALRPYVRYAPFFLLCILLPALAMLLRSLRRRSKAISGSSAAAAAAAASVASVVAGAGSVDVVAARNRALQDVRRRLSGARRGMLGTLWDETVRAVWDTVAMGGRGLV